MIPNEAGGIVENAESSKTWILVPTLATVFKSIG